MEIKYDEEDEQTELGNIFIYLDQVNFDYYKRTYPRLQALLAEIMIVVNLLFGIGRFISDYLSDKKMSRDIVNYIFNNNEIKLFQNEELNIDNNKINNIEEKSENASIKIEYSKRKFLINENQKLYKNCKINKSTNSSKNKVINELRNNVLNDLNYYHIIKSFFCTKDKKGKLINSCYNLIYEELCIEHLLKRLYELENQIAYISNRSSIKTISHKNKKLEEINELVNEIERSNNIKNK